MLGGWLRHIYRTAPRRPSICRPQEAGSYLRIIPVGAHEFAIPFVESHSIAKSHHCKSNPKSKNNRGGIWRTDCTLRIIRHGVWVGWWGAWWQQL